MINILNLVKNIDLPQALLLSILIHGVFLISYDAVFLTHVQQDLKVGVMPADFQKITVKIQPRNLVTPKPSPEKYIQQKFFPANNVTSLKKASVEKLEEENKEFISKRESEISPLQSNEVESNIQRENRGADRKSLESLIDQLSAHIAKFQQYPRIAQMREWQGKVLLEVRIKGSGALMTRRIIASSGFKVLDNEGLSMIDRAAPFPPQKSSLRDDIFTVLVPIKFALN